MGVKTVNHTSQRQILFILERATKKFQGDLGLWMQYLSYTRKQGSHKKVEQIWASILRFHPANCDMWILAANHALDERADVAEARGYIQRGLRFCKNRENIWIEYARLEMCWIVKVSRRRKVLGLDEVESVSKEEKQQNVEERDGDVVALPSITAEPFNISRVEDEEVLAKLEASPALSGAIPMAIFDSAMQYFNEDGIIGLRFFDMTAEFHELPCTKLILDHIIGILNMETSENPESLIRFIRQPVLGINATFIDFPTLLGTSLNRMKTAFRKLGRHATDPKTALSRSILDTYIIDWLLPYLKEDDLDPDIRKVTVTTIRKVWGQLQSDTVGDPDGRAVDIFRMIGKLHKQGLHQLAEPAMVWASQMWPNESDLLSQAIESRT